MSFTKIYILEGIGLFLAVSPIIAIVYRLKKGYWIALIFAEMYSFLGIFAEMQSTMRSIYSITAAFCIAGYYETTPVQFAISLLSLLIYGSLSVIFLQRLNQKHNV